MEITRGYSRLPIRVAVLLAALLLALPVVGVAAANPTMIGGGQFAVASPPPQPFDAAQLILEFAPGAAVPTHHHGGPGYITILTGQLQLIADGITTTYRAGDSFVEVPSGHYKGVNNASVPSRLIVTYLVPKGSAVTTAEEAAPPAGPATISQAQVELTSPPQFELVQSVERFVAGDTASAQATPGARLLTVAEGVLDITVSNTARTYAAGEHVIVPAGQTVTVANKGANAATLGRTELRPASLVPVAGLPGQPVRGAWLLPLLGLSLIVAGVTLRRRAGGRRWG